MSGCILCGAPVERLVDFGPQPVASRFLPAETTTEYMHSLQFGQCPSCGLAQLYDAMPAAEVVPRYQWITYNEPEAHLDDMTERMLALPGITRDSVIAGVSCKDDTTLDRCRALGYEHTWRIDLLSDLGVESPAAGMESVTSALTTERAEAIAHEHGLADIVLIRHALEHAYDVPAIVLACVRLLAPGGHLVVEIPDASRELDMCDYASVWEEHTAYFSRATFESVFPRLGMELLWSNAYAYPFEDSLVVFARPGAAATKPPVPAAEFERAHRFGSGFSAIRARWRDALESYAAKGQIVLFGAGHVAVSFLGLYGLGDLVSFVLDDSEHKRGMFMPGTRVPIVGSDMLGEGDVSLCLMCLSPQAEEKVLQAHAAFIAAGGTMASMMPASAHALKV